jgi:hypothetical protein
VTHFWEFGWEALVAIGTIGLTLVTAYLAATTRRVAKATLAEVSSQWRPVLAPAAQFKEGTSDAQDARQVFAFEQFGYYPPFLTIWIRNVGRGPALFVRAEVDPEQSTPETSSPAEVAPGDEVRLGFRNVAELGQASEDEAKQVLLDYRDLAGRSFSTAIIVKNRFNERGQSAFLFDVRHFEGRSLTKMKDAAPPPGLRALPDQSASKMPGWFQWIFFAPRPR